MLIAGHILGEVPTASLSVDQSPVLAWELAVPTMMEQSPRSFIQPNVVEDKG